MKTIILGFSRPKKLSVFARLIMWADSIPYDHVYVKWTWEKIERDIIYQASKIAVNFESSVTFKEHSLAIEEYEIKLEDNVYKEIMQFCMDNSNKPYSFKQILGFAWSKSNKIFLKRNIPNPYSANGSEWVCSTLGAAIMIKAKILNANQQLDDIDPFALNLIIKNIPAIKRII